MTDFTLRKRGRPATGKAPAVLVAMPPSMLTAIDGYRARRLGDFERLERPAAIRELVALGLVAVVAKLKSKTK